MFDPNQQENVKDLLDAVNVACVEYDKYEFGLPNNDEQFVNQTTREILSGYAVIKQEEWDNVKHMLWVLLRTVEGKTDPKKDIFQKRDVEGGYNLIKRVFDCDQNLAPYWGKK